MTRIEALMQEVENAPDDIVTETLDFVRFLKFQRTRRMDSEGWTEQELRAYAARSLQYAAQMYGDEEELLPVEGTEGKGYVPVG